MGMRTNSDITVYNKHYNKTTRLDEWFYTQIPAVHWQGKQAVNVDSKGLSAASVYTVRIPASSAPPGKKYVMPSDYTAADSSALAGLWTLQNGDIVARGLIDTPDPKNIAVEHFTVTGWADNRYGSESLQHWRVDGK